MGRHESVVEADGSECLNEVADGVLRTLTENAIHSLYVKPKLVALSCIVYYGGSRLLG